MTTHLKTTRPPVEAVVPPPPRWAVVAAHTVPLLALPSGLWRVALVAGVPIGFNGQVPPGETAYILALSVVSELAALMTLGLVRPWGEVAPRWIPLIGGRRVRPAAAIVPACVGAALIALICAWALRGQFQGMLADEMTTAGHALLIACYLPLLGWSPLLLAVTYSYWRRHRRATAVPASPGDRVSR
ncbi:hypothetical protein [Microtetraspora niveoalba]|uniref:hypothetical protein n=1 Tax=Microtetraspora niveoalba TaxID=46175 RepID=UPI0008356307|nr:hypothetical protein [Microtetraspora niveoalba]